MLVTRGVSARPDFPEIIHRVRTFDDFNADCDPHGEHDFIALEVTDGRQVFAKFDYYNLDMTAGSEDPGCPEVTLRVLTLMMDFEYSKISNQKVVAEILLIQNEFFHL